VAEYYHWIYTASLRKFLIPLVRQTTKYTK
jgi:hypothetical protein